MSRGAEVNLGRGLPMRERGMVCGRGVGQIWGCSRKRKQRGFSLHMYEENLIVVNEHIGIFLSSGRCYVCSTGTKLS